MPSIKLQSSDGEIFPVDVEIAKQSVTIKTMLEDLGMDEEVRSYNQFIIFGGHITFHSQDEEVVPLPNVNAAILKKVIQWATYHKDDPPLPEVCICFPILLVVANVVSRMMRTRRSAPTTFPRGMLISSRLTKEHCLSSFLQLIIWILRFG